MHRLLASIPLAQSARTLTPRATLSTSPIITPISNPFYWPGLEIQKL